MTSSMGDIALDIPRDRDGEFEPQIVKKHQTDISSIEDQALMMLSTTVYPNREIQRCIVHQIR